MSSSGNVTLPTSEACSTRGSKKIDTFEKLNGELSAFFSRKMRFRQVAENIRNIFANVAENICDNFTMNKRKSDCQRELSSSTKTPKEVYRIALSYEREDCAHESYTGKLALSAPHMTIEQETRGMGEEDRHRG